MSFTPVAPFSPDSRKLICRNDVSIDEQFEPVGRLIRWLSRSSAATRAVSTIYVAAARHAPFLELTQ
jgi:hypothetical protein